jgi:hypothetical protein
MRRFVLWLANWARSLATWAFPAYDIPVPRWVLPLDSFERMVIDGTRKAHGARVTVTLKDGELWFHGIALKSAAENRKEETEVVRLEDARRKRA